MNRPALACAALALPLVGCVPSIEGDWVGECDFSDANYEDYIGTIELTVEGGRSHNFEGAMDLNMPDGRIYTGDVTGIHSGSYIEIEAEFASSGGTFKFRAEAEQDGEEIDGDCYFSVPGGSVNGLSGKLELDR
jgi:hypothetical protein